MSDVLRNDRTPKRDKIALYTIKFGLHSINLLEYIFKIISKRVNDGTTRKFRFSVCDS